MSGFESLPPSTRRRINRKMNQKWRPFVAGLFVLGGTIIGLHKLITWLIELSATNAIVFHEVSYVIAGVGALVLGILAFLAREIKKWAIYPFLELAVGIVSAANCVRPGETVLARMILLLAGVRIIVDAIKRLNEFLQLSDASDSGNETSP